MELKPRPYQQEALDALNHHICNKDSNPCVVIPTGGGKSILIAWAIQYWKQDYPQFRVCILAHRKELIAQNSQELRDCWPGADIGVYAAGLHRRDTGNSILFASIDSVYRRGGELEPFNVVIVDEAHRIPASGEGKYREFLKMAKLNNPDLRVIGFTATPYRMGCGPICHKDHLLHEVCYEANVADLIAQGYLCHIRSKRGHTQPDLTDVKRNSGGDYIVKSLAEAVDKTCVVSQAIAEAVKIMAEDYRRNAIFFCVDVEHCQKVSAELRRHDIHAPAITASTPARERDRVAADFKRGKIKAICNVNVYTEGFNAKQVDCIVLLRPTLSKGLYCLDEKTEILTEDGWKCNVDLGEKVATFNMGDSSIDFEPVLNTIRRPLKQDEKFYSICGPGCDIRVTNHHNMVYSTKCLRDWRLGEIDAVAQLKTGAYYPVSGLQKGLRGVPLTNDELRFIGWVMTDGTISKYTKGISISQGEHQPWCEDIRQCLRGCGFKFTERTIKRKSQYKSNSDCVLWTLSYGKPRGTGKHLRGWKALEPFLSKNISPELFQMTESQFDIMLEAIHLGDGTKYANRSWTQRSYHIASGNRVFAERLQMLGILRGYKSNITIHTYNQNPLYFVHLKKTKFMNIGSQSDNRPRWKKDSKAGEMCWCVETARGTLLTRRNGKVVIVGNCQMCGRGLRIHPDKKDCLILDFAHCIDEHGPLDCLEAGYVKLYDCPKCGDVFSRAVRICPGCGWEIPKEQIEREEAEEREKRLHEITASSRSILSAEPEILPVDAVRVHRHVKAGKPDSLRVEYRCGLTTIREWICLDHEGLARQKANRWWSTRFGEPIPTVEEALSNMFIHSLINELTETISVVQEGKYRRITSYQLTKRMPVNV